MNLGHFTNNFSDTECHNYKRNYFEDLVNNGDDDDDRIEDTIALLDFIDEYPYSDGLYGVFSLNIMVSLHLYTIIQPPQARLLC